MSFSLKPTNFFLEQLAVIGEEGCKLIDKKLQLVKINPFRNKRIIGYKLFLFRIRFKDNKREKRIIYLVDKNIVKILCILNRDKEYNDLKKYLKKLGYL